MANFDIKVSLYSYRAHGSFKRGRLQLLCGGKDCNVQFINSIGRIAVERIPTYAFAKDLIKIERINPETGYHDSIPFNHDMMRNRLKNTPIMNIDPGISYLHERYWKNVDYLDENREIHDAEKRIEAYIDVKNDTDESTDDILHVTTDDMKIYVDNVMTNLYNKDYPLLIISLQPKEAFKCSLKGVLGIGVNDTCWDACSNFYYDQETVPDKMIVSFRANSQFDEFSLVSRALEYFKTRTNILKEEIHRLYLKEDEPTNQFQIILNDEDHTMGEPINYELQSHPDIRKSSCVKHDHLVRQIMIEVSSFEQEKLLNAILESMDNLMGKIKKFEKEFLNIDKKEKENLDKKEENQDKKKGNHDKKKRSELKRPKKIKKEK